MTAIKSQEANFKDIPIEALDANSAPVLHKGAVVIFKTNNGNYGKLQIVSVEQNQITYNFKVFKAADGSEIAGKTSAVTKVGFWWDLDIGVEKSDNTSDLDYNTGGQGNSQYLIPLGGAVFLLYSK